MGGREFAALLEGADPQAGSLQEVQSLIDQQIGAAPSFAEYGGPFRGRAGAVCRGQAVLPLPWSDHLPAGQRAALAALYCAQTTAYLVERLWAGVDRPRTVVVEGPLAQNALYLSLLQALLPEVRCQVSLDAMEGTARGAWLLSRWGQPAGQALSGVPPAAVSGLAAYHQRWLAQLDAVAQEPPSAR
jgi:hypothetical protein